MSVSPDMALLADLTNSEFTIVDLLTQEAGSLCRASPTKGVPKVPKGSTSLFTQQSKEGHGPGHSVVRRWPSEKTPAAWGEGNRAVLLEEKISPSIWESLQQVDAGFYELKYRIMHSHLSSWRSNDNGNEQAFRDIVQKLLTRITSIALLFFINRWLKHTAHEDFSAVLKTLRQADVQVEYKSEDSESTIVHDIASRIGRNCPIPRVKELSGASETAVLTVVNTKSTGSSQFTYQGFTSTSFSTSVQTVDQSIDLVVQKSSSSPEALSIADLNHFLAKESGLVWPQIATSHLAQVRLLL